MATEYKKFSPEHVSYVQKTLLQGQLESLMTMKHLHSYKALRNEEILHKIQLKTLIEHTRQEIEILLKNLPTPSYKDEPTEEEEVVAVRQDKKKDTIENELDSIRAKLSKLQ
jgi:hypothetical protein